MPQKVKYGLRKKGDTELLGINVSITSQQYDGVGIEYELTTHGQFPWLVDKYNHAENVMFHPKTRYSNSDLDSPIHVYKAEDLEIVRILLDVQLELCQPEVYKKIKIKSEYNEQFYPLYNKDGGVRNYDTDQLKKLSFIVKEEDGCYIIVKVIENYLDFTLISYRYLNTNDFVEI